MPVEESLMGELESAVEQVVEESKPVEEKDVSTETNAAADVGTEAVVSEDGATGTADADGGEAATVEEGSAESGDGQPDPVDTGTEELAKVSVSISDAALTEAVQHGIPVEDARLFPNDAALGRAVQAVRKSIEQFAPKQEEKEEEDLLALLPTLDPEKFDEDVQGVLNPILDILKKQHEQLKELRKQTGQQNEYSAQARQQAVQQEIMTWFDGQIANMGDDFKDVLGVGGTDALPANSPQKAKRDAIANQAAVLFAGYNATGTAPKSRDDVFKQAAKMVLAEEYSKLHEKKLSSSLQKRSKQHIQRAGGNQKARQGGDPAAIAAEELKKMFPSLSH